MEKLDFINKIPKENVYAVFHHIVMDDSDYDKITRKKMVFRLYQELNTNKDHLYGYVRPEIYQFLKKLLNREIEFKHFTLKDHRMAQEAVDMFLLYYNEDLRTYKVPDALEHLIKKKEITKLDYELEDIYYFIKGVMQVRGAIDKNNLSNIYSQLKPNDIELSFEEALYFLPKLFIDLYEDYLSEEIEFVIPEFYHSGEVYRDYHPVYPYTFEMYKSIGKNGLNLLEPTQNAFYDILKKNAKDDGFSLEYLIRDLHFANNDFTEFSFKHIINRILDIIGDIDQTIKLYNSVIVKLPRWIFKGDPIEVVDRDLIEKLNDKNFKNDFYNEYVKEVLKCPCGSNKNIEDCCANEDVLVNNQAILDPERGDLFYEVYYDLLYLVNEKYRVVKHYKDPLKVFDQLDDNTYFKLRDLLYEDNEIFTIYQERYKMDEDSRDIFDGIKSAYDIEGIAITYEDQKLVVMDIKNHVILHVSGIISGISLNLNSRDFPLMIKFKLVPLSDVLTYLVHIYPFNVTIGSTMKKTIYHETKEMPIAKNRKDILKIIRSEA
jgi:hypothetical protein